MLMPSWIRRRTLRKRLIAECADKNKIFPRQTTPIYISRLAVGWKASKADL